MKENILEIVEHLNAIKELIRKTPIVIATSIYDQADIMLNTYGDAESTIHRLAFEMGEEVNCREHSDVNYRDYFYVDGVEIFELKTIKKDQGK